MKRSGITWSGRARLCLAAAVAGLLAPVSAVANSAAVDYFRNRADRTSVPTLLSQDERTYYKDLFAAIEHQD